MANVVYGAKQGLSNAWGGATEGAGSRMPGETKRGPLAYFGEKFMGENPYTPTASRLGTVKANEERRAGQAIGGRQQGFEDYLQAAVQGRAGASVAEQQMGAGRAQAIQAARSQAASARGGNVALANRMSAGGQAQAVQSANRDAAMLRAQEQLSREQLVMQQQQNQRLAELQSRGMSIDEAKAQLQAETAEMQARTQISEGEASRGQSPIATAIGAIGALSDIRAKEDIQPIYEPPAPGSGSANFGRELSQISAQPVAAGPENAALEDMARKRDQQRMMEQMQTRAPAAGGGDGMGSGLIAGMQLGNMLSDARAKMAEDKIQSLSAELDKLRASMPEMIRGPRPAERPPDDEWRYPAVEGGGRPSPAFIRAMSGPSPEQSREDLGPVQPYTYRYKPEAAAAMGTDTAPRAGVMAQDLEQSPAYQASVIETPQGKALDKDRLLSANTAELGGLDKRLKELEAQLRGGATYPTPRQPGEPEPPRPKARAAR